MAKRRRTSHAVGTAAATRRRSGGPVQQPRRRPTLALLLGIAAVVGVIGFVGLAFLNTTTAATYTCDELLRTPSDATASDGFGTESLGQQHVAAGTKIRYGFCPPTSGGHFNAAGLGPLRPGFYGPDDAGGPGGWVHNLEHGYVVGLYRCEDGTCPSDTELAALRAFVANGPPTRSAAACGYRSKVLVARFDDIATPFALLAWDRALLLDTFDTQNASDFASRFIDSTGPEPNAC
jgi:hypothetical protein